MKRIALIMAGGSGERFWPLSRPNRPKQLLALTPSNRTLLEDTVGRIEPVFHLENIFVVTSAELLGPIQEQLPRLSGQILDEPSRKNSAGAIVWGMGVLAGLLGEEDLAFTILPSDHKSEPIFRFRQRIQDAMRIAEIEGKLVTMGIEPTRPETGYGYIERGAEVEPDAYRIASFIEKPPLEKAEELIAKGSTFWNSGLFFWRFDTFRAELEKHSLAHFQTLDAIVSSIRSGSTAGARQAFEALPNVSIDHALMEKSRDAVVVRGDFEWDDLGAWDSLSRVLPLDENGNALAGNAACHDSSGCVVVNATTDQTVQVLGGEELIVVVTEDAVMVCPKSRAQEVRRLAR